MEYLMGPLPEDASFGERLIYYRKVRGLSQTAMADLLGVDRDTVADAEHGQAKTYIFETLIKLDPEYFGRLLN